jgi:hypothetical protein
MATTANPAGTCGVEWGFEVFAKHKLKVAAGGTSGFPTRDAGNRYLHFASKHFKLTVSLAAS